MGELGIIGAGAAGLMAAVSAAKENPAWRIFLWEKNPVCGKKIRITGKGRCNLTNNSTVPEAEEKIIRGGKFLRTALYAFPPESVMAFFENAGVPLKTERGGRVFPVSDKAGDIAEALIRTAKSFENIVFVHEKVLSVQKKDGGFAVITPGGEHGVDRVILACGGASYPLCGSTGDGYAFAEAFSHRVEKARPSLIPLITREETAPLMGLSLKNVRLRIKKTDGKLMFSDFGEMLFTHFGISGPLVLSASAQLDFEKDGEYRALIDWKPALTVEMLDARLQRDFAEKQNRDFLNALEDLLPKKAIPVMVEKSGVAPHKKVHSVTREERMRLLSLLKAFPLSLVGTRPLAEAIVTRGGVALSEINPRNMESKKVPHLYFAGEIIDADALTGGYNLQIAFSTGHLAGKSAVRETV